MSPVDLDALRDTIAAAIGERLPIGVAFVLVLATDDATSVDSNVDDGELVDLLVETAGFVEDEAEAFAEPKEVHGAN